MSHILVCTVPFHGHVNPTLAVVRELVARGETVHYYVTAPFRSTIEATGALFKGYESLLVGGRRRAPGRTQPTTVLEGMVRECFHVYHQVIDAIQADPPDYLIYDSMCLWGPLLARQLDIMAIAFHTSFVSPHTSVSIAPRAEGTAQPSVVEHAAASQQQARSKPRGDLQLFIQNLHEEYPCSVPDPNYLWTHVEPLNIVFFPHILQPDIDDERFLFVGPSIRPQEETGDFPLARLVKDSTLYISLGTVLTNNVDFYHMCFKAFEHTPWQVVLSFGTKLDRASLGPVPANFLIAPHVPQLAVLQQTAVFLTHGGMNSVAEALYYGVPMVLCPQTREQIVTAKRIVALGLGVMLIPMIVNEATLADAVSQIASDPAFRARAQQVQEETQAAGGYQRVVDTLMQIRCAE